MAIAKQLGGQDTDDIEWEWHYWESLNDLGEAQIQLGLFGEADVTFRSSLSVAAVKVNADTRDADWQFRLSQSHDKLGNVQQKIGDSVRALQHFREGLTITQRLVEYDMHNSVWLRQLAIGCFRVATTMSTNDSVAVRRSLLLRGRTVLTGQRDFGQLPKSEWGWIERFEAALKRLNLPTSR